MNGSLRANDIYIRYNVPLNEVLVRSIGIDTCVGLFHWEEFLDRTT